MTLSEKRIYLIKELLAERPEYRNMEIPGDEAGQRRLLRSLFNVRMPEAVSREFLDVQDSYLQELLSEKHVTTPEDIRAEEGGSSQLHIWQGDITTLAADAIVNAANSQLLGCFCPCHGCIDNAIHTFAGVQLRLACADIMEAQRVDEPTGHAKITPAYNLPCRYVLHTVGPIVHGALTKRDRELLASCYRSCLALADEYQLSSIAFCCISTGEFHFPNDIAAEIAVSTVKKYKQETHSEIEVIFNVWKDIDRKIYERLLG